MSSPVSWWGPGDKAIDVGDDALPTPPEHELQPAPLYDELLAEMREADPDCLPGMTPTVVEPVDEPIDEPATAEEIEATA